MSDQEWEELGVGAQLAGTDRSELMRVGAKRELARRLRALERTAAAGQVGAHPTAGHGRTDQSDVDRATGDGGAAADLSTMDLAIYR